MKKIKVVWICSFSSPEIREILSIRRPSLFERVAYHVLKKQMSYGKDSAIWNVNAIKEFENFQDEIELHVVCAIRNLKSEEQTFVLRGVHYHCFREENSSLLRKLRRQLFTKNSELFAENRRNFSHIIADIKPDI